MAIAYDIRSDTDHMGLLEALIARQGIEPHGLFLLSSEGRVGPDGYEEMSGYVLGKDGRAFFFWTGWDEAANVTGFMTWEPAEVQPDWLDDEEFQAAQRAAGLI